ncbi:hypothetical protein C8J31_1235 [Rhizobium sp. PP-CC-2G-626]|nr:hypothetical protein C8J31_1235 [Rhizobium sp. PP-CC-2G-626]
MANASTIDGWRQAPRLTSFSAFFDRTAGGLDGMPDVAVPRPDLSMLDFDVECAVFFDTQKALWGAFDSHYFASIPFRLEEECRLGAATLSFALNRWMSKSSPATLYTLGAGTGCLARTLGVLGGGRIKTLCCSPTTANQTAFHGRRGSEHAHFFLGPFFELDDARYASDDALEPFRKGFDILLEDTTFQMYGSDRVQQLDFIMPKIRDGGLLIQVQKLSHPDRDLYDARERQKDDVFKPRYFSRANISEKKSEILDTMVDFQVDLETTTNALRSFFRYSVATWNSGNFYTIVSSNSRSSILAFISLLKRPALPPAYCYAELPLVLVDTSSDPIGAALRWRGDIGHASYRTAA